jgi:hypothetical protein
MLWASGKITSFLHAITATSMQSKNGMSFFILLLLFLYRSMLQRYNFIVDFRTF